MKQFIAAHHIQDKLERVPNSTCKERGVKNMLLDRYFSAVDELLHKVRSTQRPSIEAAGLAIAKAVAAGGCVHIHDTGHIVDSELIFRGGGLILYKKFKYALTVDNPVRTRDRSGMDTSMAGLAVYALKASGAMPGDVMILGSVSGRNLPVVDLALEARNMGLLIIVLTSMSYTTQVQSDHPCGKRIFELADIVLDNCAPAAEAMIEVEGNEARFAAASGISASFIMWSVTAVAIEEMMKLGINPGILKSANYPGGNAFNAEIIKQYQEKGW
jgi:uncharacterized phosphosugar-binding protein